MINHRQNFYSSVSLGQLDITPSIYARIANVSFVIFLFFAVFGTSLPFQEKTYEIEDIGTSNIVNQILYSFLFLASCLSLAPKFKVIISFIKREKFLTLFLVWSILSVIWSDFSFISLKRVFQFFTIFTVILAVLLHSRNSYDTLKFFQYIFSIYIILTFLAVIFIPEAIDYRQGAWKGFTPQKNLLGQASLISILIWYSTWRFARDVKGKIFSFLILSISVILLIGAKSSTALLTFLILTVIGILFYLDSLCKHVAVGRLFSVLSMLSFLGILVAAFFLAQDLLSAFFDYLGKDITFTGRTVLWMDILEEVKRHLLFGTGFQGFWVVENINVLELYEVYVWLPNQAHNGYLDILNETGLVGLLLFFFMILAYFYNLAKMNSPHFWKWFFITALIINITESTMFKPRHISGVMFLFSYIALYCDLFKNKATRKNNLFSSPFKRGNQKNAEAIS